MAIYKTTCTIARRFVRGLSRTNKKKLKKSLKKAIGKKLLKFLELQTILTHIEAVVNTHPLSYFELENKILTPAKLLNIQNLLEPTYFSNITQYDINSSTKENLVTLYTKINEQSSTHFGKHGEDHICKV